MKPTLLAILLSAPALGATTSDVRQSFIADCTARGTQQGNARAAEFCVCSVNAMEDNLTMTEFREVERHIAERRKADTLPQMLRILPAIQACKK